MTPISKSRIIALVSGDVDSRLTMRKALQLGDQLQLPVDLRAFLSLNPSNGTYSAEKLNQCMDQLHSIQHQMEAVLEEARKRHIDGHASVKTATLPELQPEDDGAFIFSDNTIPLAVDRDQIKLQYLHFNDSRKTVQLDKSVILAEGEPLPDNNLEKLCAHFRKSAISMRVVLIEGKSNLIAWQEILEKCNPKDMTIDILASEDDFKSYLKKYSIYLLCLSRSAASEPDKIGNLHKLNKSDILLF